MTSVTCPFCSAERSTSYQITAHLLVDHNIEKGQKEVLHFMEQKEIIQDLENSVNNHHQQMTAMLQKLKIVGSRNPTSNTGENLHKWNLN